jgi:DNA-directed RNA polymerase subunit RPC12/RpoP
MKFRLVPLSEFTEEERTFFFSKAVSIAEREHFYAKLAAKNGTPVVAPASTSAAAPGKAAADWVCGQCGQPLVGIGSLKPRDYKGCPKCGSKWAKSGDFEMCLD